MNRIFFDLNHFSNFYKHDDQKDESFESPSNQYVSQDAFLKIMKEASIKAVNTHFIKQEPSFSQITFNVLKEVMVITSSMFLIGIIAFVGQELRRYISRISNAHRGTINFQGRNMNLNFMQQINGGS